MGWIGLDESVGSKYSPFKCQETPKREQILFKYYKNTDQTEQSYLSRQ